MEEKIAVNQSDLGLLLICAERYAIGRKTYMPSTIAGLALEYVKQINDNDLLILKRDLKLSMEYHIENDDMKEWQLLHGKINDELDERGYIEL